MGKFYDGTPVIAKRLGVSKSHVATLISKKMLKAVNLSSTGTKCRYRVYEEDIQDYERRLREANGNVVAPYSETTNNFDISAAQKVLETAVQNAKAAEELKEIKKQLKQISEMALELSVRAAELSKET